MQLCQFCRIHTGTPTIRYYGMASRIQRQISSSSTFMVVGLGNADYPDTRHSVGMAAVDRLAEWLGVRWTRQRALQSMVATAHLPEAHLRLVLVKPKTFMNINGKSIQKTAHHYGVDPPKIYLIHDELDRPVGATKLKEGGSARGHNGVRSAITHLKTDVMPRLLIGIDRPADKSQVADYVLERFKPTERQSADSAISEGLCNLLRHLQSNPGTEVDLLTLIKRTSADSSNRPQTAQNERER